MMFSLGRISNFWIKSSLYGLLPSLVQLFVVFPLATSAGVGGLGLGLLTPLFVLVFNTLGWSIPAYAWLCLVAGGADELKYSGEERAPLIHTDVLKL
mmetsp:Transcript_37133/g.82613  ORF Transcript_37133/g.82613 Transcript_37133/m.82613 type:complete len:97 (-) Transcript_37133:563-853(-)